MSNPEKRHIDVTITTSTHTLIDELLHVQAKHTIEIRKDFSDSIRTHLEGISQWHSTTDDVDHLITDGIIYTGGNSEHLDDKGRLEYAKVSHRSRDLMMQIVDLILEPDEAEEAMGDLEEGYASRHTKNKGHAVRWVWAQTIRIAVNRTFDLIRQYARAKTGK